MDGHKFTMIGMFDCCPQCVEMRVQLEKNEKQKEIKSEKAQLQLLCNIIKNTDINGPVRFTPIQIYANCWDTVLPNDEYKKDLLQKVSTTNKLQCKLPPRDKKPNESMKKCSEEKDIS